MLTFSNNNIVFSNDLNAIIEALKGNAVVSGLATTAPGGMNVLVGAGGAWVNGVSVTKAIPTTIPLNASNPINPRKDIIVMNSSGTISAVSGTVNEAVPSTQTGINTYLPQPSSTPTNYILLSEIWIAAGVTAIVSGNITDKRIFTYYNGGGTAIIPVTGSTTADWQTAEANIVSLGANDQAYLLHSLVVDMTGMVGTVTMRLYMQVDGVEIKTYEEPFTVAANGPGRWTVDGTVGIHEVLRVTAQSDAVADNGKTLHYDYMLEAV